MSKACDRCGDEMDEIALTLAGDMHRYIGVIDLCEKCADSFDEWFWRGVDDE